MRRGSSSSSSGGRGRTGTSGSRSASISSNSSACPWSHRPLAPPPQASGGCITTGKARATSSSSATGYSATARCDTYLQCRCNACARQAASRTQLGLLSPSSPPRPTPALPPLALDAPGAHHLPGQGEASPSARHAALAATGPATTAHDGRRHRPVTPVHGARTGGCARRRADSNRHQLACRCAGPAPGDARGVRRCRVRRAGARSRRSCRSPHRATAARPRHPCRPLGRVRRRGARRGLVCLVCLRRGGPEL